jgi:NADH-quinone oxidoreductase subunit L
MAFALIVLAIGSVLAGYAGFPLALGGSGRFERFLAPSFTVANAAVRLPPSQTLRRTAVALAEAGQADQAEERAGEASRGLELGLMGVSTVAAIGGIGIAWYFFIANRNAARRLSERFIGLHTLLSHKYYVDEIYDATLVQPIRIVSDQGLWRIVDARIIDGTVNGVAESVRGWSELLRRLQSGSVRAYAASLFFGVVVVLGYYLWR